MKKTYVLAPLAALLLFTGVYVSFQSGHQARETAREARLKNDRDAKLAAEVKARRQAVDEALVTQARRKKERDARESAERAAQEARQLAVNTRDKAFRDQERAARQLERVKKEIAAEEESLAKLDQTEKSAAAEQVFLKTYVQKTEANARALEAVLLRFAAAESARLAAAQPAQK